MIQSTELRVGSYYRCKIYNGNNDVIIPFTWQEYEYAHLFDPVPLTEKILQDSGFILNSDFKWNIYKFDKFTFMWVSSLSMYVGDGIVDIKYVHELQNLYYVLTKKEIPIKLL